MSVRCGGAVGLHERAIVCAQSHMTMVPLAHLPARRHGEHSSRRHQRRLQSLAPTPLCGATSCAGTRGPGNTARLHSSPNNDHALCLIPQPIRTRHIEPLPRGHNRAALRTQLPCYLHDTS